MIKGPISIASIDFIVIKSNFNIFNIVVVNIYSVVIYFI